MWRSILAVILLPSLAAAQTQTPSVPADTSSPPQRATPRPPQPSYRPYTFYDQIRRGTQEDIVIQLSPQGWVTSPRSPAPGIVPLKLELQPADGLTVSSFRYPRTQRRKVKFQAEPVPVSRWPETSFKIRADRDAALGLHTLKGKLAFQVVDYGLSSVGPVQEMDVQIPVMVVERNAKVQKASWPAGRLSAGMIVLIIVLLPVEIPIGLLLLAGCAVSPRSCPD
jgi:hypothetical protein